MKAISIKQPYAGLILSGLKTLEIRSWPTDYRGPLLICSSKGPDAAAMRRLGIAPDGWEDRYPIGQALGVVEVVGCRKMTPADAAAAYTAYKPKMWAHCYVNPRRLAKTFYVRGQLGLFEVPVGQLVYQEVAA